MWVKQLGHSAVPDGDSRLVKLRLDPKQQGPHVLEEWFAAVPLIVTTLESGLTPEELERTLRKIFHVGELTAKEMFVHLAYARPKVADTRRHIPVGPGSRAGAILVLKGGDYVLNHWTFQLTNHASDRRI